MAAAAQLSTPQEPYKPSSPAVGDRATMATTWLARDGCSPLRSRRSPQTQRRACPDAV
jgi:hypothetical protein